MSDEKWASGLLEPETWRSGPFLYQATRRPVSDSGCSVSNDHVATVRANGKLQPVLASINEEAVLNSTAGWGKST